MALPKDGGLDPLNVIANLQDELAAMTVIKDGWVEKYAEVVGRLKVAERLFRRFINFANTIHLLEALPGMDFPEPLLKLYDGAQAFLTTPATGDVVKCHRCNKVVPREITIDLFCFDD